MVSVDVELSWSESVGDTLRADRARLMGAREKLDDLLELFSNRGIRATWPVVGVLFCRTKRELLSSLPDELPVYESPRRSPYAQIAQIGPGEAESPCHYGASLVDRIAETPGQEIASRTFSNFRCFDSRHTPGDFESDLRAAIRVAQHRGIMLRSLAVPSNCLPPEYCKICGQLGFSAYRGTAPVWPYSSSPATDSSSLRRKLEEWICTVDTVVPLTGTRCVDRRNAPESPPVNVAATRRFQRPIAGGSWVSSLQRRRVFREMDRAARDGGTFHLWWRLRDMAGENSLQLEELDRLLERFDGWRRLDRMESVTMHEVAIGERDDRRPHSLRTTSRRRTTSP